MTDLHTHILPGMDDGPPDVEGSLALLRAEIEQGIRIHTVAMTPHFYRSRETPKQFLARREKSFDKLRASLSELPDDERQRLPRILLGAEVAWVPNLAYLDELPLLCIQGTGHMLLELPFSQWDDALVSQLYNLPGRTGITPIIAHIERYLKLQRREHIEEILSLDMPVQINAETLLHPVSRRRGLNLFKEGRAHVLASDCHNTESRPPNLAAGIRVLRQKLGAEKTASIVRHMNNLSRGTAESSF